MPAQTIPPEFHTDDDDDSDCNHGNDDDDDDSDIDDYGDNIDDGHAGHQ